MNDRSKNNGPRALMTVISIIAFMFITGTIISVSRVTYSNSVFDNCLFIGDSRYARYVGIATELESLGSNISVQAVSGSTVSEWTSIATNGYGSISGINIKLPSSASCVSIMLGANSSDSSSINKMQNIMQTLHNRYPNAKIVFNSIYHLGSNYTYADENYINKTYDTFNAAMANYCNSNSSWAAYVDITSGIHDANGYLKYPDSEGIHLIGQGKTILKQNIQQQVGAVIGGGTGQQSNETPSGEDDDRKITLKSNSNYPWSDGSNDVKTISCDSETYLSEINGWLKNSPDVWWCSSEKTIKQYFDNAECGMTFSPCTNSTNADTSTTDTSKPVNDSVPFDDVINGDRCYKGKWVRVTTCQNGSVDGARCKLSDGTLVLRKGDGLTAGSGCEDLTDSYTDIVDDYRCNSSAGKWVYISSCQSSNLTGAKCKTENGTIIRTNLTDGPGCSSTNSSNQPINNTDNGDEISDNPFTGTREFIICMIIAIIALIISGYYFRKNKLLNINNITNS